MSSIEYLKSKPKSDWLIEDWQNWSAFCEEHANECQTIFLKILKENSKLKQQIEKYEGFISQKFGMPKRGKTKGLLSAPRGRPMKHNQIELVSEVVKSLRSQGKSWIEIQDKISMFNSENGANYPTSIRYLRHLIKSAI